MYKTDAFVVLQKQESNVLGSKSAIAAGADAVCFDYPLPGPASQCIAMYVEKLAHFLDC